MKKSIVSLLTVAAFVCGMTSCNNAKKQEDTAKKEEVAVKENLPSKSILTVELKNETVQLLKDMPDSELPYRLASGSVTIGVGDMSYMLPVAKAADLNTLSQKARACGMYYADLNILKATKQPTADVEKVLAKLTTELNVPFILDILKEKVPANATKEQMQAFFKDQETKVIEAMAANDKIDIQIEMIGGMSAEYACLLANPKLVVKGDATSAGLSDTMMKRVDMLNEIIGDLSEYYPNLKQLSEIISPLKEDVASVQKARDSKTQIEGIRNALLK